VERTKGRLPEGSDRAHPRAAEAGAGRGAGDGRLSEHITGIVLAAGTSSRLGRPKQLLDLAGKPVLRHVIETLSEANVDEVVVVLGHRAGEIRSAIQGAAARVVVNPDYEAGQSTSLRAGLNAAGERSRAAVILLGDQPGVRPASVSAVILAWRDRGALAVQASYSGVPGHPVLFDRSIWPEISQAEGDEGARTALAGHPQWRTLVEVGGDPPLDIDTEDDYERVRAQF
jgi:molybdenum cofactor cytidylyltransferase